MVGKTPPTIGSIHVNFQACFFLCFAILFPHLCYPSLKKQTDKNANFYQLSLLSRICHCVLLHPTLVGFFPSVSFYFSLLLFFFFNLFFLSLIFGLFKPMSSLPICRTVVPELHHSHRNFQDKSGKKKLQRLETVGSRAQSRVSEFNSSPPLPFMAASPCHVSLAWPTCQNDESPKERVPASEPVPGQVFVSPATVFVTWPSTAVDRR